MVWPLAPLISVLSRGPGHTDCGSVFLPASPAGAGLGLLLWKPSVADMPDDRPAWRKVSSFMPAVAIGYASAWFLTLSMWKGRCVCVLADVVTLREKGTT